MSLGRIAHLTSAHAARDVRIFEKECRSLSAVGYDVVLIAPAERDEVIDGVSIRAVPISTSRRQRMTTVVRQVYRLALDTNADIYHFHDPELITAGLALKLRGKKVIYDVHENLPQDIIHSKPYLAKGVRKALYLFAKGIETGAGAVFDAIVTITDDFALRFPKKKTWVVSNYPIVGEGEGACGLPYSDREPVVVFTGGLARGRCARQMVEAIGIVQETMPATLLVAGPLEYPELVTELSRLPGWANTRYAGQLKRDEMSTMLDTARVGLLVNTPRPDYVSISTNKLYEYMIHGLPIVSSRIPSWQRTIEEVGCGLVADSDEPVALADAIIQLLAKPNEAEATGALGRVAALEQFTWASEERKLLHCYNTILRGGAG